MKNNNWTSVEDGLPETTAEVSAYYSFQHPTLRYSHNGRMHAHYSKKADVWYCFSSIAEVPLMPGVITHWQPLPEPPKAM